MSLQSLDYSTVCMLAGNVMDRTEMLRKKDPDICVLMTISTLVTEADGYKLKVSVMRKDEQDVSGLSHKTVLSYDSQLAGSDYWKIIEQMDEIINGEIAA